LSGGRLIVYPSKAGNFAPEKNIIVGNTVLYGGIEGDCFFRGVAGERFAVRNSGVTAVVEGVGDHGCEYMTGGVVVVLGQTGRNFAAGMSGGIAYVLDEQGDFEERCNRSMVDLEAIDEHGPTSGGDIMSDMARDDALRLKALVEQHAELTGSGRAKQILDLWGQYLPMFVKVFPVDYRRALEEIQASLAEDNREDATVLAGE
jgi:glutamate synthase (NADPH/NADH) large chain